jgi:hypothetical protein
MLRGGGADDMARSLVTKMAARDVSAVSLVESEAALRDVARQMGLVGLPGSAKVTVADISVKASDRSPAPTGATADSIVTASYILQWSGNGQSESAKQKLTATIHKDSDGVTRLIRVVITPALAFDAAAYFGTSGASLADAEKVVADLEAGAGWLPGVTVKSVARDAVVTAPDVNTVEPGHLTTWKSIVSAAVPGSKTSWSVEVSAAGRSYLSFVAASKTTQEPVAAQVKVGDISPDKAVSKASIVRDEFWDAVERGDLAAANGLISTGPKLSASGLPTMKSWGKTYENGASAIAKEGANGPEVQVGRLTLILGSDGSWSIDSSESSLVMALVPGNGHREQIVYRKTAGGKTVCTSYITIELNSVEFHTNGAPSAIFQFTHSGTCDPDDDLMEATVGWKGNAGTKIYPDTQGTDPPESGPVLRYVQLPEGATSADLPIWIKITKYGNAGAVLPYTMSFATIS